MVSQGNGLSRGRFANLLDSIENGREDNVGDDTLGWGRSATGAIEFLDGELEGARVLVSTLSGICM